MDLFVRLLAIEEWAGINSFGFDLYERFIGFKSRAQGRTAPTHRADDFVHLIQSFQATGYVSGPRIVIDASKILHHGMHRLACALFFGISEVPVSIERSWPHRPDYTLERLRELSMDDRDIEAVSAAESRYSMGWRQGRASEASTFTSLTVRQK